MMLDLDGYSFISIIIRVFGNSVPGYYSWSTVIRMDRKVHVP
jgi:hypothetical protein